MKIEKGIPIPCKTGRPVKYDFSQMVIGDSFAVPFKDKKFVAVLATKWKKSNPGRMITCRTVQEKGEKVSRFWMVEDNKK